MCPAFMSDPDSTFPERNPPRRTRMEIRFDLTDGGKRMQRGRRNALPLFSKTKFAVWT